MSEARDPERVIIVDYRPDWPDEFAAIAADLRAALGALALRIDHIGSTAVPGLPAKDRIDVQVSVADVADPRVTAALVRLGYTPVPAITADHQPPGADGAGAAWAKRFFRPPAGQRPTNLHVRGAGRANQRYALLFRDYLRAHPAAAAAYAETKRRLAAYHADDRDAYTLIKDPVCDLIMVAAEAWAVATGWQPGPSDG